MNVDEIKANNRLEDIISKHVDLKKNGHEFLGLCPFHSEKSPSFTVKPDADFYHCFGCGENGDVIDFVMKYNGVNFIDACKILGGEMKNTNTSYKKSESKKVFKDCYEGYTPIMPVPDNAPLISERKKTPNITNPKRDGNTTNYKPSKVYEYHNSNGYLIGYVLRIDFGDGKKITPAIMYCKHPDGSEGWCHYTFPEPKPIYGINYLPLNDAPVLIVEGEKCADAARILLPNYTVISWSGGTNSIDKTDWSLLKGRKVILWGDADKVGQDAMNKLAGKLSQEVEPEIIKIIEWDKEKPKGWDAADALAEKWNKAMTVEWAKKHMITYLNKTVVSPPLAELQEVPPYTEVPVGFEDSLKEETDSGLEPNLHSEPKKEITNNDPFKALGFNKNIFFYMPKKTKQAIDLSPGQHTKNNLLLLASQDYWEINFPSFKASNPISWDSAVEALLTLSARKGIFDGHESIRGRGAWLDEGRPLLHLGGSIYMDGKNVPPEEIDSKYIYEASSDLNIPHAQPATNKEAYKLVEICRELTWENKLSAELLAGWCVIAPVCGILKWRPHIWVTGAAGSGKTTVVKDIIQKIIGTVALNIEGKTTEAGIRQQLQQDARPIIFDEAEAEDDQSAKRMQAILDLARVSSSGGRILKGTVSGVGISFSIRSCFCFSSINTSVQHYADETRISKLVLQQDKNPNKKEVEAKYKVLHGKMFNTFTPEFSAKMLARSIEYLPILQKNCEVFIEASARILKSRRLADQIGTLLAGTYLCHSTKEIKLDKAIEWIEKQDWTEHTAISDKKDEERLLDTIATYRTRVDHKDISLGELILDADEIDPNDDKVKELARFGIKIYSHKDLEETYVLIANKSIPLTNVLQGSSWAGGHARPLKDIEGAKSYSNTYFAPGIRTRAVAVPIRHFKDEG